MFLGKTHDSQSAPLHPGVLYIGTSGLNHPIHPIKALVVAMGISTFLLMNLNNAQAVVKTARISLKCFKCNIKHRHF